jgi:hypothetical protein
MKLRSELDQRTIREEREARYAAEEEASRLMSDLAALLGMEDSPDSRAEIQRQAIHAQEEFQRKERADIEALKAALSRALDELTFARDAEKAACERATKAALQASMYEQEGLKATADLKRLKDRMDEIRESESTKRESLEYRIASLQNDNDVLRRQHANQVENLQNELVQVTMERDRFCQSFQESERSKNALLRAKSDGHGVEDVQVELCKLRLEKAQLLVVAAEEAARVERRLHEAREADKSSAEADIILERELRHAAETSLENIQIEMNELRAEMSMQGSGNGLRSEESSRALRSELDKLTKDIVSLKHDNDSLRHQLETSQTQARETIEKLREDCREAKARASQFERDIRKEAEIQAELSRIQARTNGRHRENIDPAEDDEDDFKENPLTRLYDGLQTTKMSIEEERVLYRGVLEEHEVLCAKLAEQEILYDKLSQALVRIGGDHTLHAAIREAKEALAAQYDEQPILASGE